MSLNGYSWVDGNVVNAVDPSGMQQDLPCTSGGPQGFANCGSDGATTGYGGRSVYTPTINWQRIAEVMRRLRQLERICFWLNGNLCFELGRLLIQDQAGDLDTDAADTDVPCPFSPCEDVEDDIMSEIFYTYDDALHDLRRLYGYQLKEGRLTSTSDLNDVCPEVGKHTTMEPHRDYPFSIICCPCCNEWGGDEIRCYHTG